MRASDLGPTATPVLVLSVGRRRYAVALGDAREVLAAPETISLPDAPGALVGLCNVRGTIVPLFDLAVLHRHGMVTAPTFAVVVDVGAELAGFVTSARPWVGEARPTGHQRGRVHIREAVGEGPHGAGRVRGLAGGRRRVAATLLDIAALLPFDPGAGTGAAS